MCGSSFFPNNGGLVSSPRLSSTQKCSDNFEGNEVGAACPLLAAGTQVSEGAPKRDFGSSNCNLPNSAGL